MLSDELNCDICGAGITDYVTDLFHHSGIINVELNGHIHLCLNCQTVIAPPVFNFDKYLKENNERFSR